MTFDEFGITESAMKDGFGNVSGEIDAAFARNGYDCSQYWNGGARSGELWKEYTESGDIPYMKKRKHRVSVSKGGDGYSIAVWDMQRSKNADYRTVTAEELEDTIKG